MKYYHGIEVKENATSLAAPTLTNGGVQVVFGIAPINLLSNPSSAVNKLFYCESFDEAKEKLGYSSDTAYTICQSMDACFKLFSIAPVIFCNVLNPLIHRKSNASETYTIADGKITLSTKGILLDTITITADGQESAMIAGTDYATTFDDDGNVIVAFLGSQTGIVTVTSYSIDPTAVTSSDIIGGVDSNTGVETGLELVRQVFPRFSRYPSFILAPGFSSEASVAAALASKCVNINGKFKAECCVDIDTTTVTKYTNVATEKNGKYMNSEHMIVLWPKILQNDGRIFYYSVVYAALATYYDYKNDEVPSTYSNRLLNASGAVLSDGTEVMLDETQANVLNENGIVTAINQMGWRTWGNNTGCYPGNTDPKDRWINCRRMFSWWGNSFITTYMERVDNNMNYRLIESVVDDENIRANSYKPDKIADAKMVYNKSDNPISQILDGKIKFKMYLAPYTPAEFIENTLEFDPGMLENTLGGE